MVALSFIFSCFVSVLGFGFGFVAIFIFGGREAEILHKLKDSDVTRTKMFINLAPVGKTCSLWPNLEGMHSDPKEAF